MKKQITPGIYSVDIQPLESLGWEFSDTVSETANALEISEEEARQYEYDNYHVEITVNENMTTLYRFVNTKKKLGGIDEGSDNEVTGDDEQTITDLEKLIEEGKVWNIINY